MWKKILIAIAIFLFISIVIYIVICDYKNQDNLQINNLGQDKIIEKSQPENCMGAIEGELSYPSAVVPSGSIVCAKNIETNNYYCTPNQVIDFKYRNKKGYMLEVPKGIYNVSGIFPFFYNSKTGSIYEYKYTGQGCNIDSCVDINAPVTVNCETISNIDLFEYGALNVFEIFF